MEKATHAGMMASLNTPSLPQREITNNTGNEDISRLSLETTESKVQLPLLRKEENIL